jgi:protein required for attachment to host cells
VSDVWVVVASSTHCRIFSQQTHSGPLLQIEELFHPKGRLRAGELAEDRAGRSFDRLGEGRHAMGQPVDPVETENIRFAKIVATTIEEARKKARFERLLLVVEPRFLGHLRQHLSRTTRQLVTEEVQKNLVDADPEAIRAVLPFRL